MRNFLTSMLILLPSLLAAFYLYDHQVPVQYGYFVACTILMMAVLDFATVIFIEKFHNKIGKLSIPALLGALGIIFLFMVTEAMNRFVEGLGYTFLDPLIVIGMLVIGAAIFTEKNLMLRSYIGINGVAMALLWAMGASDKVIMPF